jgi:hypothetical protein
MPVSTQQYDFLTEKLFGGGGGAWKRPEYVNHWEDDEIQDNSRSSSDRDGKDHADNNRHTRWTEVLHSIDST